jgi:Tfp pilus assembly protein PilE
MKCCEKGRSMIEMLGVLAIVGVLSVGAVAGYSKAMTKYKRDKLMSQIAELVINIRTLYFQQTTFSGISKKILISAGAIPNGMYDKSDINNSDIQILHAMSGEVLIFPSRNGDEIEQAFEVYIKGLDQLTCLDMAITDWGQDPSSGFKAMYIGTDDITSAQMINVTSSTDANPGAGIYTPGKHDMSIPLTVNQARAACACDAKNCVIGLKYI